MTQFDWTGDRVDLLRRRHDEGKSFSVIANELGAGCTRSAAIGKAHRLGLHKPTVRVEPSSNALVPPPKAPPAPPVVQAAAAPKPKPEPIVAVVVEEPAPAPERLPGAPIPLMALTLHMCRWPLGEPQHPDFGFCGRPVSLDHAARRLASVYCAVHAPQAVVETRGRVIRTEKLLVGGRK